MKRIITFAMLCMVPLYGRGQLICEEGVKAGEGFPGGDIIQFSERECAENLDTCGRADVVITFAGNQFTFSVGSCTMKEQCSNVCVQASRGVEGQFRGMATIDDCVEACCNTTRCNSQTAEEINANSGGSAPRFNVYAMLLFAILSLATFLM